MVFVVFVDIIDLGLHGGDYDEAEDDSYIKEDPLYQLDRKQLLSGTLMAFAQDQGVRMYFGYPCSACCAILAARWRGFKFNSSMGSAGVQKPLQEISCQYPFFFCVFCFCMLYIGLCAVYANADGSRASNSTAGNFPVTETGFAYFLQQPHVTLTCPQLLKNVGVLHSLEHLNVPDYSHKKKVGAPMVCELEKLVDERGAERPSFLVCCLVALGADWVLILRAPAPAPTRACHVELNVVLWQNDMRQVSTER